MREPMRIRYLLVSTLIGLTIATAADAAVTRRASSCRQPRCGMPTQDIARVGAKPEQTLRHSTPSPRTSILGKVTSAQYSRVRVFEDLPDHRRTAPTAQSRPTPV